MERPYEAELVEERLIVWDPKQGSEIYKLGFFGKPVGIPKPKIMEFDVPLTLDLIEGLYLLEKGVIKIRSSSGKYLSVKELFVQGEKHHERFRLKYMVYENLRDRGYVVTPGIKFGCDFAVYERGPGIDHAPFLVSIKTEKSRIDALEIVRAGRLATTVKKNFIVAIPNPRTGRVKYLMFKWWKP
jgi:tRNA-intron endonuclease